MSENIEHPENSPEYEGLKVNKGIPQPEAMNPNLAARLKMIKRRTLGVEDYVEGILRGDINILSQAITLVESAKPEHQAVAQEVIRRCLPSSGQSVRIGITGVPGAGKSTFIERTRPAWRNCRATRMLTSVLPPRQVRWEAWRGRRARR